MTIANRITIFRVFLIPVFCVLIFLYTPDREWLRYTALGVYIFVAVSDFVDGYLARRLNQRTQLGTRLDPLADKLVINLGFVFLAANLHFDPTLPYWFPVFILARDIGIVMGAYAIKMRYGKVHVEPQMIGKITTGFQMATIIGTLLGVFFLPLVMWATVLLSIASIFGYLKMGYTQLSTRGNV